MLKNWFLKASVALGLAMTPILAEAATITLNATQDAYIRPNSTNTTFGSTDSTKLMVTGGTSGSGNRAATLLQFDLSSIAGYEITGAYLRYYDLATGGTAGTGQTSAFVNDTYVVYRRALKTDAEVIFNNSVPNVAFDKDGVHESNVTYSSYTTAIGGGTGSAWVEDDLLPGAGSNAASMNLSLAANNTAGYYNGGAANAATLATLNLMSTTPDQGYAMFLSWFSSSAGRTFASKEYTDGITSNYYGPQLVLEVIPEPSTFAVAGIALAGLVLLRKKNL